MQSSLSQMLETAWSFLPNLAAATAILVGGWIIYGMLSSMPGVRHSDWVTLVCLPQTIRVAFEAIFTDPVLATTPRDGPSGLALGWLAFLTIGSLAGVWNKVSAPFRA